MKFENETIYSKEVIEQYNVYHLNHSIMQYLIIVIAFVLSAFCFYLYITTKEFNYLLFAAIFLLIIGISKIFNNIIVKIKSIKFKDLDGIFKYKFYDEYFMVNNEKIMYKEIDKITYDDKLVYLFMTKTSAYIIQKKGFRENNAKEFISFIKNK